MKKAFLLTAFLLAGCTGAQMQAMKMQQTFAQATQEWQACMDPVYANPAYAAVTRRMPGPENQFQPSIAQLADKARPTQEEAQLLIRFQDDLAPCKQALINQVFAIAPPLAQSLANAQAENQAVMLQLIDRKITWGKANQERQKNALKAQEEFVQISQQMDANLAAAHQAEMAQRQAASNAILQWSQQQQLINALNRPPPPATVRMNCTTSQRGPYGDIHCF